MPYLIEQFMFYFGKSLHQIHMIQFLENLTSADLDLQLLTSILSNGNERNSILTININSCEQDALQTLLNIKDVLKDGEIKRMTTETLNKHFLVTSEVCIVKTE